MLDLARTILPTPVLIGLTALLLATLYGAAAFWAVGGRAGWLVRVAPVALLLAALSPLGAYELIVLFGTQVVVVIAWVLMGRFGRVFRAGRNRGESRRDALRGALEKSWGDGPRFQLRDLLKAVLLVAGVMAIVRFAAPSFTTTGGPIQWGAFILGGAVVGTLTVAAAWMVFGQAGWYFRVPAMLLLVAIGGYWQFNVGQNLPSALACSAAVVVLMTLARMTDWAYWRRETTSTEHAARGRDETPTRVWRRLLSRAAVCAVALLGLSILIPMYRMLLPPAAPRVVLPDPNGYNELVRIANPINWFAIPSQNNAAALAAVREALMKPSRVPIVYGPQYIAATLPDVQVLRSLARALTFEAKLAEAEGRHADAVKIYLDIVQVSDATSAGGLVMHDLVRIAIAGIGLHGMAPELSQLDSADLAMVCERLEISADSREPFERLVERDEIFGMLSYGWPYLSYWLTDELSPAYEAVIAARQRSEAHLQLVLAEAAVRRYALEHGSPPESLAALVPEYLSQVPRDAYRDAPLVYRRTPDGYLLYSVGSNGTDDGGQRVRFSEAAVYGKGDLFYDANPNEPANSDAAEESLDK